MADEPKDGSNRNDAVPTVRDLKGPAVSSDTLPDVIGVYAPPRPVPEASRHRTLDLQSVRISDEADPRRAVTELRLPVAPVRDARRTFPVWLVLVVLSLCAVVAWAFLPSTSPTVAPAAPAAPVAPAVQAPAAVRRPEPGRPVETKPPLPAPVAAPTPAPPTRAEPSPALSGPKPLRSAPETAKKRRDPWLE